jgi:CheY-like chemotaxis protein
VAKRKLLLADDSVTIQKVVNLTFADEGIEVITVGDGDSALEKISEVSPDVVLADVHMPGLSGYQICEIVRENPATKDLPVVLLVGSFEPFDENEAARVGANAFLTKPFQSIRQLVTQVSDLMESSRAAEPVEEDGDASFADTDENLPTTASIEEELQPAPVPKAHDTSDIESLYQQSFGPSSGGAGESTSAHFVDAGMDDEMIEARHADDVQTETAVQPEFEEESGFEERTESFEEAASSSFDEHTPSFEEAASSSFDEHTASFEEPVASFEEVSASEDEYKTEPTVPSPFDSLAADERGAALEEPAQQEDYFDHFASTEKMPSLEQQVAEATASFDLDEVDLLELPPLQEGKTVELTTTDNLAEQHEKKQVMSLSPELMEMIVQKVVDKLSEK